MKPTTPGTVGHQIRMARQDRQMSQQALASAIGRSRQHVNNLESGKTSPTADDLQAIATALNVSIHQLLPNNLENAS